MRTYDTEQVSAFCLCKIREESIGNGGRDWSYFYAVRKKIDGCIVELIQGLQNQMHDACRKIGCGGS